MENEDKKLDSIENTAFERKEEFFFTAGEEAKDANGQDVDSQKFSFVQQDKKIHDVKFTTKPTTFMKDAMKRFTKNKSSVVGGIILGLLFAFAIILPMTLTGYDTTKRNNYETHLPMKLFPAGTGWWDGTTVSKNSPYPYKTDEQGNDILDGEGNRILVDSFAEQYPDKKAIVKVENKRSSYLNYAIAGASGGYATLSEDAHKAVDNNGEKSYTYSYMYHSPMSFDFTENKYTLRYTLGTIEEQRDNFVTPEYGVLLYSSQSIYLLSDDDDGLISDYGEKLEKPAEATLTPHKTIEISLNDLLTNQDVPSSLLSSDISFGLAIRADETKKTALFVKDFEITGVTNAGAQLKTTVRRNLKTRAFGVEGAGSVDANALVLQSPTVNDKQNPAYWYRIADNRFEATDVFGVSCDITYDMYTITYGLRNHFTVSQADMDSWIKKGLVEFDYTKNDPSLYKITDAGQQDNTVYVTQIESIEVNDTSGTPIYTFYCQVMMYKYLGYSSVPIHLFGTEYQGKDMLKYVFSGLRTSLILGIIVSAINIIIGVIWGSISGYYGGAVDLTMERITDIIGGIPWIVLMTVLVLKMGTTFFVFALALCLTGWIGTATTTRSQFYRYRGREYVLASKTLGARSSRLIFKHILPNAIGTIVTRSVLMIPSTIFTESTISYLGLGLTNLDSLGVILSKNQAFLSTNPSELVIPAIIISLLMICFNLFGNGLRDAFNPSLKGED